MIEWLHDNIELAAVYLLTICLIVGGEEIGAAIARRGRERPASDADRFLSCLATPSIGLLALMIGFTFSRKRFPSIARSLPPPPAEEVL